MELPKYVQFEPVGQCNLRCQMCALQFRTYDLGSRRALASWELFTRLVDEIPTMETLQLQGLGEPMMHPRFFDMVSYAAERGIRVTTNTNLTMLNDRRAELCLSSGLDTLHASIDALTPTLYEEIRVHGSFARVQRNMERLMAVRRQHGATRPRVHVVMVIMRKNLDELPALVRQCHDWSVDQLYVQQLSHEFGEAVLPDQYAPMRDFVRAETLLHEDPARVTGIFDGARALAQELGLDLRLPRVQPKIHAPGTPGPQRCDWPWTSAYVTYDGYLLPCCIVATPDRVNLGSMADGHSFEELWNGTQALLFRNQLDSDEPPDVCKNCSIYHGVF